MDYVTEAAVASSAPPASAKEALAQWTSENTPAYSLDGMQCWGRLLSVHDGDTVTVAAEAFPGRVVQLHLRLAGIDTPEMTSKDPAIKARAEAARVRLTRLLAPDVVVPDAPHHLTLPEIRDLLQADVNLVFIRCGGMDKYGRVLAALSATADGRSAADVLLEEGLAKPYDGGKKSSWDDA